ncbi:DNA repair protein RecN [Oscillatoria sp. CS-180]|uniref:DNA repair protein RecN n=1 Tax=Oscillatoria sp. CS-180 TaxID=3021720 RepID=UPI00232DB5CC|nr:DNA repair protein RecN [Oscillatoria sp. CS-180]MDB9525453.1 DNA repair protein RecN [Oscillatoria sp. CS-180]
MLVALKIENFALIDNLTLDFEAGLNVLTGETGAGKSILLDALDVVLGGRVSQRMIRAGEKRGLIEATFKITERTRTWLKEHDVPMEGDRLICVRELTAGKNTVRSRSRLNEASVNKPQVEALRLHLIEITAQGQTLQVGDPQMQLYWLDGIGGQPLAKQRQLVAEKHQSMTDAKTALERRKRAEQQRQEQLDLFDYQWKELSAVGLEDPEELAQLEQEQQRLSHAVELQQQSYQTYQLLYESDQDNAACADLLGKAVQTLEDMQQYDNTVEPILDMVNDALAQVEEAGRQMNAYGEDVETDPQRLQDVQARISQLKQLTRKYGKSLADLIDYVQEIQASLELLNGEGQSIEVLEAEYEKAVAKLDKDCQTLTDLRKQAAKQLEDSLIKELKPLAMDRVQFQVSLTPIAPTPAGADKIQFLFSPNPGEPLQPLAETASGGEMSRFLLALKACLTQLDIVNTLVFDEVDVGVSGRVAQAIAEKLYQLGRSQQVLCVTHQPMVAAMADAHFRVGKEVIEQTKTTSGRKRKPKPADSHDGADQVRTVVRVVPLDEDMRRDELAQLAGGQTHQEALSFADSLLKQAKGLRQS